MCLHCTAACFSVLQTTSFMPLYHGFIGSYAQPISALGNAAPSHLLHNSPLPISCTPCCPLHLVIPFLRPPLLILFVTIWISDVLLGFIFSGINSSGISRASFRPQSALTALWLFLSSHPISPWHWHCCSSPRRCSWMVLSDLPLDIFLLVLHDSLLTWPRASTGRACFSISGLSWENISKHNRSSCCLQHHSRSTYPAFHRSLQAQSAPSSWEALGVSPLPWHPSHGTRPADRVLCPASATWLPTSCWGLGTRGGWGATEGCRLSLLLVLQHALRKPKELLESWSIFAPVNTQPWETPWYMQSHGGLMHTTGCCSHFTRSVAMDLHAGLCASRCG